MYAQLNTARSETDPWLIRGATDTPWEPLLVGLDALVTITRPTFENVSQGMLAGTTLLATESLSGFGCAGGSFASCRVVRHRCRRCRDGC